MHPKTFYLFRHGETRFSKSDTPYGAHEHTAEILPEAVGAIERIAHYLKDRQIDYAIRSEFLRCRQTAAIIESLTNLSFISEPQLNEFTETQFDQFHKRMVKLATTLQEDHHQSFAICTHGAVIAALRRLLLGKTFHAHDLMYYPKTGQVLKVSEAKEEELSFREDESLDKV